MPDIDIRSIALIYMTILIALTVHEFAHAWMADSLGDDTPRRAGRLSLNPIALIRDQPIGALVVPLIAALMGGMMGWASTPVNYSRVRRGIPMRRAMVLITAVGPFSNLLLAVVASIAYVGLALNGYTAGHEGWQGPLAGLAQMMVIANVFLAMLNMLPIPPLDGFTVVEAVTPARHANILRFLQEYSMVLMVILFMFGGRLLSPAAAEITARLNLLVLGLFT